MLIEITRKTGRVQYIDFVRCYYFGNQYYDTVRNRYFNVSNSDTINIPTIEFCYMIAGSNSTEIQLKLIESATIYTQEGKLLGELQFPEVKTD